MLSRERLSGFVGLTCAALGLCVLWQAVRFCLGDVGVPAPLQPWVAHLEQLIDPSHNWMSRLLHYVLGISLWVSCSAVVFQAGSFLTSIVALGWTEHFRQEEQRAELARQEAEQRARLRELSGSRGETEKRSKARAGFSFTTLAIGYVIGKFF